MSIKALIEEIVNNRWLIFALRVALGGIFIAASVTKLPHQAEFINIVTSYGILPDSLARFYALIVPWAELLIGCSLVLGLFTRFAAALSIPLIVSFIIASAYSLFQPVGGGCGCFGQSIPISHSVSLAIDAVMLLMAVPLLLHKHEAEFLSIGPLLSRLNLGLGRRRFIFEKGSKFAVVALAVLVIGMPLLHSAPTNLLPNQPAKISYSPSSFSFTATEGGANPLSQTLEIWNSGGGTLDWSVSDNAAWLSLDPTSGSSTGEHDPVTVSVDISEMAADDYSATITIWASEATNTPRTVPVSLTINQPPHRPSNALPPDGATGVSLTPTLQSSDFSDPNVGDTHAASQWQVATSISCVPCSQVFNSGTDTTNLPSITIPSGTLSYDTTYYWHVRHQDNHGTWSEWSVVTSFTTQRE